MGNEEGFDYYKESEQSTRKRKGIHHLCSHDDEIDQDFIRPPISRLSRHQNHLTFAS
jgi:hypothetical protein